MSSLASLNGIEDHLDQGYNGSATVHCPNFHLPNSKGSFDAEWLNDMNTLISIYSDLLACPLETFWSKVKSDKSISISIVSFMEKFQRNFASLAVSPQALDVFTQLYFLVLLVLHRVSELSDPRTVSNRETEKNAFANSLLDIPMLIDVSFLYGNAFPDIVSSILRSVLCPGSSLSDNVILAIQCTVQALEKVELGVSQWQFDDPQQFVSSGSDAINTVSSTIEYILETSKSLGVFLSFLGPINPSIAEIAVQQKVVSSLADFYNTTIIAIRDRILRSMTWSATTKSELLNKLTAAASALAKLVRVGLVEPGLVNRILHQANANSMEAVNTLIDVMAEMLNYPEFAKAFDMLYPIVDDINLIRETVSSKNIDKNQLDYLQDAFSRLSVEATAERNQGGSVERPIEGPSSPLPPSVGEMLSAAQRAKEEEEKKTSNQDDPQPRPGPSRPPEFIAVKAVLPDTDDDLIVRCLQHYNNDSQAVISGLLDGSVPLAVTCPSTISQSAVSFEAGNLWQGKKCGEDPLAHGLSREERNRVAQLAVSVWDDADDDRNGTLIGGRFNYGDPYDDQTDEVSAFPVGRHKDLLYDDEYDDTFDVEVGGGLERADSEPEEEELDGLPSTSTTIVAAEPARDFHGRSNHVARGRGQPRRGTRGNRQKNRYYRQQQPPQSVESEEQPPVKNVLNLEHPEDARQRRQQAALTKRAMRRGRVTLPETREVPTQPSRPYVETTTPTPPMDTDGASRRSESFAPANPRRGYGQGPPRGGRGRGRGGGKPPFRGQDSGDGNLPEAAESGGPPDAFARRWKERRGGGHNQRRAADRKRML